MTHVKPLSRVVLRVVMFLLLPVRQGDAQSTQGMITGRVYDRESGAAVLNAAVSYRNTETDEHGAATANKLGVYTIAGLSPGSYRLRVEEPRHEYQAQEIWELDVRVAARVTFDFPLRPVSELLQQLIEHGLALPDSSALLHFFGPDMDPNQITDIRLATPESETLAATLSYVVDREAIENVPLAGRDPYAILVVQPAVTADNATARGLGLSVNGQRPTASNFLLDGVENNNYLLSGLLTPIAPEAVQEYRISTTDYSAEYGRTAGFVANVVTRGGGDALHGVAYAYFNHDALNAASFLRNAGFNSSLGAFQDQVAELKGSPLPKPPERELYAGFWIGGPMIRHQLFWSAAFEQFRSRSREDPIPFQVPIFDRVQACKPGSPGVALLAKYRPPAATPMGPATGPCDNLTGFAVISPEAAMDRSTLLARLDSVLRGGRDRITGRFVLARSSRPDFGFNPYPDFRSGLGVDSSGLALTYSAQLPGGALNEARFGWRASRLGWGRAHDEQPSQSANAPVCAACMPDFYGINVSLPGSALSYGYGNRESSAELSESINRAVGRHVFTAGGGALIIRSGARFEWERAGTWLYATVEDFLTGNVNQASAAFDRRSFGEGTLQRPSYGRDYSNNQFYGFAQDSMRVSRRLTLNAGLRYEWFGANKNTGTQDAWIDPGVGDTIEERVRTAKLRYDPPPGNAPYRSDNNNWAARFGLAADLTGRGRTVFRSGYGIFYDRPFENLTQTAFLNNVQQLILSPAPRSSNFPAALDQALSSGIGVPVSMLRDLSAIPTSNPRLLWIDANLRTPYSQTWFAGVQHHVSDSLYFEVTQIGALGRKLIATDQVNRVVTGSGHPNTDIGQDIQFRSNFGSSTYLAISALTRYRARHGEFQASYTYGHSIDNQSDPLQGLFGDLGPEFSSQGGRPVVAARTVEYDSRVDRASSDYDQRHNLVFYSLWELPWLHRRGWTSHLMRGWRFSQIAGFRSGFPYTVLAGGCFQNCPPPAPGPQIVQNRPNIKAGTNGEINTPARGGRLLLNPAAFVNPAPNVLGNVGRNAFTGPGFWNVDLSLAKSFRPASWPESRIVQIRSDFFNAFNHSNLGSPAFSVAGNSDFGYALFGRQGVSSGFPALVPLNESPRRIQLQVKFIF
jgi:hypothetical protein